VILPLNVHSFENTSAPFTINEHDALWKNQKYLPWNFNEYLDFKARVFFISEPFPRIPAADD
jgi:hypothetical protein